MIAAADHAPLPAPDAPPVGLPTKVLYGLGSIAYGVKDNGFQSFLLLFYNQIIGLPTSLVGAAVMVALIVDAGVDPLIGQVSDHFHSRFGRRHPFMYASAAPVALSYLLLFNPPKAWSHAALFVYLVVAATIVRTCISLYEVPSSALAAELAVDYDRRTEIMSWRVIFGFAGGVGMTWLAYLVFLRPTPTHPVGQLNPEGYSRYGVAAAAIMFVAILVSAAGTHRRIPFLAPPPPRASGGLGAALTEMAATLSNRSFLAMLVSGLCTAVGGGIVGGLYIYMMTYFYQLSTGALSVLLLPSFLAGLVGSPAALWLSGRIGKKWAAILFEALAIVVLAAPVIAKLAGVFPPSGSPAALRALFAVTLFSSPLSVAGLILMGSMIADTVEASEAETGRRAEGLIFAAVSFVQKAISGTGVLVSGLILALVRFPQAAKPGAVDPAVLSRLAWAYLASLVACWGAAILVLLAYRISRASHVATVQRLEGESPIPAPAR